MLFRSKLDAKISAEQEVLDTLEQKTGSTVASMKGEVQTRRDELLADKIKKKGLETENEIEVDELQKKRAENEQRTRLLTSKSKITEVKRAQAAVKRCKQIQDAFGESERMLVESEREHIQKATNRFFKDGTNNPELYTGIELDPDYRMHIKLKDYDTRPAWEIGPSAGQSSVIALSFVAALRSRTLRKAPVIIDTPIGILDLKHRKNMIHFWEKLGGQVIILYTPAELNSNHLNLIQDKISSHYQGKRSAEHVDVSILKEWDGVEED